jgi:hypothetical protein
VIGRLLIALEGRPFTDAPIIETRERDRELVANGWHPDDA